MRSASSLKLRAFDYKTNIEDRYEDCMISHRAVYQKRKINVLRNCVYSNQT